MMDNTTLENCNNHNAQAIQNQSGSNLINYPMSSSANSNTSKTPPQAFSSHPCQFQVKNIYYNFLCIKIGLARNLNLK